MFIGLLSVYTIGSFGESLLSNSKGPVKCVSLNKHPCQASPKIVIIISNEGFFDLSTFSVNKCGGNCNTIDDPYDQVWVPNKLKNSNVKVFT